MVAIGVATHQAELDVALARRLSLRKLSGTQTQVCESCTFGALFCVLHQQPLAMMGMLPNLPFSMCSKTDISPQNDVELIPEHRCMAKLLWQPSE